MAASTHLAGLSTREAIADAIYRVVQGIDTNDATLFRSGLIDLKDFKLEMGGRELQGEDIVMDTLFNFVGPMDTTHNISNCRVDIKEDNATKACMTAYAVAQHYRKGEGMDPSAPKLTAGSIYDLDLVKDSKSGIWKIETWSINLIWRDGDPAVTAIPGLNLHGEGG